MSCPLYKPRMNISAYLLQHIYLILLFCKKNKTEDRTLLQQEGGDVATVVQQSEEEEELYIKRTMKWEAECFEELSE